MSFAALANSAGSVGLSTIVSGDILFCTIILGYSEFKSNDTTQSYLPGIGSLT